jgi:hypothetical protein
MPAARAGQLFRLGSMGMTPGQNISIFLGMMVMVVV